MNTLFVRADVETRSGTGHFMRCLALAQAWREFGGKAIFISHCNSVALRQLLLTEGADLIPLEKPYPDTFDFDFTINKLLEHKAQNPESRIWVVLDGYNFDSVYQKKFKESGFPVLWIDDFGHASHYYCDVVLNQNLSAEEAFYLHRETYTRILLGTRYALLRREFWHWRFWHREIPLIADKVLVTMGGSDPNNVTLKVIQALKRMNVRKMKVTIILGPANPHREEIQRELLAVPFSYTVLQSPQNIPELMSWADVAISAGGSTCWEMAYMGLPDITLILAENQVKIAEKLDSSGVALNLGWHVKVTHAMISDTLESLMMDRGKRTDMAGRGRTLVDGRGGERVVSALCDHGNG